MRLQDDKLQQAGTRRPCRHNTDPMPFRRDTQMPAATWRTLPYAHAGTRTDPTNLIHSPWQAQAKHKQAAGLTCPDPPPVDHLHLQQPAIISARYPQPLSCVPGSDTHHGMIWPTTPMGSL